MHCSRLRCKRSSITFFPCDIIKFNYRIKKDYLGLTDFNQADINTPLAGDDVLKTTFAEGKQLTLDALSVLGDEYTAGLKEEFDHRWIDAAENAGKRSGGYQISVYKANPFILLNWTDKLYSTYVLAHESGHAMHSWFSQHHQPAQYADAPIFLAEVASTFNEQILTSYLLEKYQADKKVQLYVLEQAIDGFIGTIYRQTQFAEFEHTAYQTEQAGQALTADFLDQTSSALLKKYYGPDVALLDGTATQSWAYVPHFYMNYYVYQYATSWAASTSLASAVWQHKPGAFRRPLLGDVVWHHDQRLGAKAQTLHLHGSGHHLVGLARPHLVGQQGIPAVKDMGNRVDLMRP